jgi:hypothetical protein
VSPVPTPQTSAAAWALHKSARKEAAKAWRKTKHFRVQAREAKQEALRWRETALALERLEQERELAEHGAPS